MLTTQLQSCCCTRTHQQTTHTHIREYTQTERQRRKGESVEKHKNVMTTLMALLIRLKREGGLDRWEGEWVLAKSAADELLTCRGTPQRMRQESDRAIEYIFVQYSNNLLFFMWTIKMMKVKGSTHTHSNTPTYTWMPICPSVSHASESGQCETQVAVKVARGGKSRAPARKMDNDTKITKRINKGRSMQISTIECVNFVKIVRTSMALLVVLELRWRGVEERGDVKIYKCLYFFAYVDMWGFVFAYVSLLSFHCVVSHPFSDGRRA